MMGYALLPSTGLAGFMNHQEYHWMGQGTLGFLLKNLGRPPKDLRVKDLIPTTESMEIIGLHQPRHPNTS